MTAPYKFSVGTHLPLLTPTCLHRLISHQKDREPKYLTWETERALFVSLSFLHIFGNDRGISIRMTVSLNISHEKEREPNSLLSHCYKLWETVGVSYIRKTESLNISHEKERDPNSLLFHSFTLCLFSHFIFHFYLLSRSFVCLPHFSLSLYFPSSVAPTWLVCFPRTPLTLARAEPYPMRVLWPNSEHTCC